MTDGTGRPTRRQIVSSLGLGIVSSLGAALVSPAISAQAQTRPKAPIPDVADGFRLLRARHGMARLQGPDEPATFIQGFDAATPGPLLRFGQGDELKVRLMNSLPDPVALHWHGVRLSSALDNAAPVQPGASFDYRFTPPDAGTFFYHAPQDPSHPSGHGLYGALIVDERTPPAIDRDVVLILDDWRLNPDGSIGREGNHLTANGVPSFDIPVKANERVRLRLINAAFGRAIALRLERHRPTVMAVDGQPAQPFPASGGRVVLGPGNRIDLFVDMTMKPGEAAPIVAESHRDKTVARFVYETGEPARPDVRDDEPLPLPDNPLPAKFDLASALRVDVPIEAAALATGSKPLFTVRRGRTVVLALDNRTQWAQSLHLHGHSFRLLDRLDDGWKPFWLDTLLLPSARTPPEVWRIAFAADNPGKWTFARRMLKGAEIADSRWFEVV